jgi:hypothetical protein
MPKSNLLYCATDKEIYDVLMSAKQRITSSIILELAKDRGIFYASKDSRESLVNSLSLLPHDYYDLNIILDHREHAGRAEKVTSVTLKTALTIEEIRNVVREYIDESPSDEKVNCHGKGTDQFIVNVKYSDIDYGKNRLVQRTPKEAAIEFNVEDDKTVIRMPANLKAKEIFEKIKNKLDTIKKSDIQIDLIDISEFSTSESRTEFFTLLISNLKDFELDNVTSVKVETINKETGEDELDFEDDQNKEEAKQEALALVRNVALKGETLLASEEYQNLTKNGFFITAIIWRSKRTSPPHHIVEFEAAFEEPEAGKGFKYSVRGTLNYMCNGEYTKTLRPIEANDKENYLSLIEQSAGEAINNIRTKLTTKGTRSQTGEEDEV